MHEGPGAGRLVVLTILFQSSTFKLIVGCAEFQGNIFDRAFVYRNILIAT